jgi:DNA-damage-inducible protein J
MSTIPTQIRIDADVKEQASALFHELGMDMSGAVNIFLRQCLMHDGLPFPVERPRFNEETLAAMREAKAISRNPNVKSCDTAKEWKTALEEDG